jgi:hypothetical protein
VSTSSASVRIRHSLDLLDQVKARADAIAANHCGNLPTPDDLGPVPVHC